MLYELDPAGQWIKCNLCRRLSHHPTDVHELYCGSCHLFLDDAERMMHETRLYTRNGEYVCTVLLPPFQIKAEGVMWGQRFFVWHEHHEQYREGLLFFIAPGYTVEPKGVDDAADPGSTEHSH